MEKKIDNGDIPPCMIFIDREGRWFHKGVEMIHRGMIELFYQHMDIDSKGRYIIRLKDDVCYVDVEDTPFVIKGVDMDESSGEIRILLNDGSTEILDPSTLWVGDGNVLYCMVKGGRFPSRFTRPAYYNIAKWIHEQNGRFYLIVKDQKYPITYGSQAPSSPS